jgi:hypothetical protein
MPVTDAVVPLPLTIAKIPGELHVPPGVTSLSDVVPPDAHADSVPLIAAGDSHMVTGVATFHRSPASAPPVWFTALSTPYMITLPVPDVGAVQVMESL